MITKKQRIQTLEKKVSALETIAMEQRMVIAELLNCFHVMLNQEQIDLEELKKLDIRMKQL